jgi:hypothetical protein
MALMWPLYGYPSKSLYQNAAASVEVALPATVLLILIETLNTIYRYF